MRKRITLGAVMFGLVLVALCAIIYFIFSVPKPIAPELGPKIPLPDNPIVFNVESESGNTLGFIDSDGSNFTTREVDNRLTRDPYHYKVLDQTTWGLDGTFLVTQLIGGWFMNPGEGIPIIITGNGETYICEKFKPYGGAWGIDSTHALTTNVVSVGGSYQYQIVNLNVGACRVEDVIYTNSTGIGHFSISSDGWIAYETRDLGMVILDDQKREVFKVDNGSSPNWSRDGEWLAYDVYKEGIRIVRRSGSDTQVVTDVGTDPWWSPDGEWLLYWTYKEEIYKIYIITKEKVLLFNGGSYPTWR